MASLGDLLRQHTQLSPPAQQHLRRLVGSWGLLADLCFSDLLLFANTAPNVGEHGRPQNSTPSEGGPRFLVAGQVRPATAQTLYIDDQVGRFVQNRRLVEEAFRLGAILEDEVELPNGQRARVQAVPVRFQGAIVAVLTNESPQLSSRSPGELERTYLSIFFRLIHMIADGSFPYAFDDHGEVSPRVGDGALVIDSQARIEYASPNAVSALHRVTFHANSVGKSIFELGFPRDVLRTAFALRAPGTHELERGDSVTIQVRLLPLLRDGEPDGALLLLRDVSEVRRQERLLVSMDATIREIHHRVKNNLQTVSSLLRLQGRRVSEPAAKEALEEAARRIRSIALVHEALSRRGGDEVEFDDVVRPVVSMVQNALVDPDRPISIRVVGEGPMLPAATASSLAVILTELVQNAVEHGYPQGHEGGKVVVELATTSTQLMVRVYDDGVGLQPGFSMDDNTGLGLTIVQTLAEGELGANLRVMASPRGQGTVAELSVSLN